MPTKLNIIIDWDVHRSFTYGLIYRIVKLFDVWMVQSVFGCDSLFWIKCQQLSQKILCFRASVGKYFVEGRLGFFLYLA